MTQANLDIWSVKDIENLLTTGEMPDGDSIGDPMAEVVKNTAQLSPDDRHAIAVYVKSLKARRRRAEAALSSTRRRSGSSVSF
jgi:hypothetical protein